MTDFTERRRLSFGSVAEQYDRARPSYPERMVSDVLSYAGGLGATGSDQGVGRSLRILDVGAGTGIAMALFAPHAASLTALEPDPAMAAVASHRAATAGTSVELLVTDFESAELPEGGFDLIVSGTAWHWVDSERRYELAARVLAPGGALAAFWNRPCWDGNPVRPGLDAAYAAVDGAFQEGDQMSPGDQVEVEAEDEWAQEAGGNPALSDLDVRRYRWAQRYTAAGYVELLGTHSSHNLLEAGAKRRLFDGVTDAIEGLGGSFELTYETLLCLARRS